MHTGPVPGEYVAEPTEELTVACRACGKFEVTSKPWESSDGAYEDMHYECRACGHGWWIEGIDS